MIFQVCLTRGHTSKASDYAPGLVLDQTYLSAWDCGPGGACRRTCPPGLECVKCCMASAMVQAEFMDFENLVLLPLSSNIRCLEEVVSKMALFNMLPQKL